MFRRILAIALMTFSVWMIGKADNVVVADSATHVPLPSASVYDRNGKAIGVSNGKGVLPRISSASYPLTIRYIGFNEKTITDAGSDTIFLQEEISELPEVLVETRRHRVLHMLAYVREYSTLSSYTDTVVLFREKMVDFMLPSDEKVRFKGWSTPRLLTCRSYYQFKNHKGLDSVSDESHHHFSWSDWIGVAPEATLPFGLRRKAIGNDTLLSKYSPAEIWTKENDRINVSVDVLADTTSRKWVPDLSGFFNKGLEFERFKIAYQYDNVTGDTVSALDLSNYSFNIESNGRGHKMFRFNRIDEPFFVNTNAEVYILDKEYISVKEAKKWAKRKFDIDEIGIYEPMEAPALSAATQDLIDRVNNIDKDIVRLDFTPDYRMMSNNNGRRNFKIGRRALLMLRQATGITAYKTRKNFNRNWNFLKKDRIQKNARYYNRQK